jgi:DamX protein
MIDEIPERDPLPTKDHHRLSLSHLAVILAFIFITLLVMLACSRSFDYLASKIWPETSDTTKIEVSKSSNTRIDLLINPPTPKAAAHTSMPAPSTPPASVTPTPSTESTPPTPEVSKQSPEQVAEQLKPQSSENLSTNSSTASNSMPDNALMVSPATSSTTTPETISETASPNLPKNLSSFSSSEKKILTANTKHYTIQLLALHDRKKLKLIAEKPELKGKVHLCRSEFKGKPWYILVYGDYPTRLDAQQAIKELPQDIQKDKPWVRTFLSLQKAIHDRK